jgi:hypothetical protein
VVQVAAAEGCTGLAAVIMHRATWDGAEQVLTSTRCEEWLLQRTRERKEVILAADVVLQAKEDIAEDNETAFNSEYIHSMGGSIIIVEHRCRLIGTTKILTDSFTQFFDGNTSSNLEWLLQRKLSRYHDLQRNLHAFYSM